MLGMYLVMALTVANSPEVCLAQMSSSMDTFKRLAAALPATRPNATAEEQSIQKAEVETLVIYLKKMSEVIAAGNWNHAYLYNYLIVSQQLALAGVQASVLPEEALLWRRLALDAAATMVRLTSHRIYAGKEPASNIYQARANHERSLRDYRLILAELNRSAP